MGNRVGRASLHAIPTKDTSIVVDVINLGVALRAAHTVGLGVLGCLDVDAVRRAGRRAQKTGHAFLQPVFVALQHVHSAVTFFEACAPQRPRTIRIVLDLRRLKHLHEGDAHPLRDRLDVFQHWHA